MQEQEQQRGHCVVVGAGIKGLCAARELVRQGVEVTVLEATHRVGGKVYTLRGKGGATAEMGGMRILDHHQHMLALADEFGLEVDPYTEDVSETPFSVGTEHGQAADLCLGTLIDAGLLDPQTIAAAGHNRETSFAEAMKAAFGSLTADQMEQCEQTIHCFLSEEGTPNKAARDVFSVIIDLRNGVGGIHHTARVREFAQLMKLTTCKPVQVRGGLDQIITGLCDCLPDRCIRTMCRVSAVNQGGSDSSNQLVTVSFDSPDGASTLAADAVLFCGGGLHTIDFTPPLPPGHTECFTALRKSIFAMKGAMLMDDRFWEREQHGGFVGGTAWVGPSEVQQIYFPPPAESGSTHAYLMTYIRGQPMARFMSLSQEERVDKSLDAVQRLFPGLDIRTKFQGYQEVVWDKDGAGAYYLSGAHDLIARMQPCGRLVFSPVCKGWFDDAIVDGEVAVAHVLDILGLNDK